MDVQLTQPPTPSEQFYASRRSPEEEVDEAVELGRVLSELQQEAEAEWTHSNYYQQLEDAASDRGIRQQDPEFHDGNTSYCATEVDEENAPKQ